MPPPYPYPVAEIVEMQALVFEFQKGAQKSNSFFKLTTTVSAAVSTVSAS
jgi:hypothetical protein